MERCNAGFKLNAKIINSLSIFPGSITVEDPLGLNLDVMETLCIVCYWMFSDFDGLDWYNCECNRNVNVIERNLHR